MTQHLCEEHRELFLSTEDTTELRDWIEPETGLVLRVNALQYALLTHCSLQPDYITERMSLVDAVFRAFLARGNHPMNPVDLAERTGRPAATILKTLSGEEIYRGLRPFASGAS
jgi:hypothetical protein